MTRTKIDIRDFMISVGIWAEGSVILWQVYFNYYFKIPVSEIGGWDLSGRLGYFVTTTCLSFCTCINSRWDLSGRLGYFVTYHIWCTVYSLELVGIWAEGSVILWQWDWFFMGSKFIVGIWAEGSVILWHNWSNPKFNFLILLRWDLSGRLGYFVTSFQCRG